jgi:hypothetical protein
MYASYFRRSSDYAKEAAARHQSSFWTARANAELPLDQRAALPGEVIDRTRLDAAFERLKASPVMNLMVSDRARLVPSAVVRAEEIVVEDAFQIAASDQHLRFVADVDVVALAVMAADCQHVADLYSSYARRHGPVALPNLLTALSVLVAHGLLIDRVPTGLSVSEPAKPEASLHRDTSVD